MNGSEDGEVRALVREKLNATGESEGAEGRLVTLKEPIGMDILEKRVKSHLKLAKSLSLSSGFFLCLFILTVRSTPVQQSRLDTPLTVVNHRLSTR